jgi:hypothetical protein
MSLAKMELAANENIVSFRAFLEHLISHGYIDGLAANRAKQVIERGYNSLTGQERYVFVTYVIKPHVVERCKRCSGELGWDEVLNALQNGGYCAHCAHERAKTMSE